jgi:hypothetical protein
MPVAPQADLAKQDEQLRLENRVLREGEAAQLIRGISENRTDILKKHVLSLPKGRLSSSRAKNHEVRVCQSVAACLAGSDDLSRHASDDPWLS